MSIGYIADKLAKNTGIEWRPVNIDGFRNLYLISAARDVYSIKRHTVLVSKRYKNRPNEYIELRTKDTRRFCQIDELMLIAFPELFHEESGEWRTIELNGEKTAYEVRVDGTVRRINNRHVLKSVPNSEGYCLIRIRHNGKTITCGVHRLVAQAFIPNPSGYEIVNHKDENRQNNAVSNLEWCDRRYNMLYNGASKRAAEHAAATRRMRNRKAG